MEKPHDTNLIMAAKPAVPRRTAAQPAGLDLTDIYYTLFQHWRMILVFSLLGVAAAVAVYLNRPAGYSVDAKLLIRFVVDKRNPSPADPTSSVTSPDRAGDNIMNSEIEILTSRDLAFQVVDEIGPQKILGRKSRDTNRVAAATMITRGLLVEVPRRSNILRVSFSHADPEVAQKVLTHLVDAYLAKHVEIHRNTDVLSTHLSSQLSQFRSQLEETEKKLTEIRSKLGIVSIEDSKRVLSEKIPRLADELAAAQMQLAELNSSEPVPPPLVTTNAPASTNQVIVSAERIQEFAALRAQLESLRKREKELLAEFKDRHFSVKGVRERLTETEKQFEQLKAAYPELAGLAATVPAAPTPSAALPGSSVRTATAAGGALRDSSQRVALAAKIVALNSQLDQARRSVAELLAAEIQINRLERDKQLQETNLRYYQVSVDQTKVDLALGPGKVTNINIVQAPAVPERKRVAALKAVLPALSLPPLAGIALAFLIDKLLRRTVRRPLEVEHITNVPLFATISNYSSLNGGRRRLWGLRKTADVLVPTADGAPKDVLSPDSLEPLPPVLEEDHVLRPAMEALRDRLVTYFELNNMTHKPKLVALTGCHAGAGVTTVATGLAAILSETGEGKVLLVDMNASGGAAQRFFRGKLQLGLVEALDEGKRDVAEVQDKLYVVAEHGLNGGLSRILPTRFLLLVPRLKLSDYDYVIFDLPHLTHTSIAPRVARFMDINLLVTEAEATPVELLRQSTRILLESGGRLGTVLNRARSYVPSALRQELSCGE